ncbi:sce7725 family protein [Erwinia sp. CPCC 100877]|nr:sce7725 family protein [Erwinia sp. CPCC 100877]
MYYPYFRGKQFDLFALTALLEANRLSTRIRPIIEPVKQSKALLKFLNTAQTKAQPFYLVQNPQAGEFLTAAGAEMLSSLDAKKALILDQPLETLTQPASLLVIQQATPALASDWQMNLCKVLIPEEFRLLQKVTGEKILSQDVFTRLPKAEYYAACPDELFSTAHLTFQKRGFVGFSDFSIDSRIYYEHGYPTKRLSLHLVYFEAEQLRIHHFLSSEEAPTQKDKFFELMIAVQEWLVAGRLPQTLGLELLLDAWTVGKFPGMGVMRKAAVMHHLELMSAYLEQKRV